MQIKMFTIYDTKVEAYNPPFFVLTNGEAERAVYEWMQDPNTNYGKYPADFVLFFAGDFDRVNGSVESAPLVNMGTLLEIAVRWKSEAVKVQKQLTIEETENGP